jgi:hypothetical protein
MVSALLCITAQVTKMIMMMRPSRHEQVGRRTSTSSKATRFGPEGNSSRSPRRADQLQRQGLINLDADDNYRVTEKKRLSTFSVGS